MKAEKNKKESATVSCICSLPSQPMRMSDRDSVKWQLVSRVKLCQSNVHGRHVGGSYAVHSRSVE